MVKADDTETWSVVKVRVQLYRAATRIVYPWRQPGYLRVRSELANSQWATREYLANQQEERLQEVLRYCLRYVPYYRHLFKRTGLALSDIKSRRDLYKIPVLTKSLLIENYASLVSEEPGMRTTHVRSSGGSTGEPVKVHVDLRAGHYENAAFRRGLGFAGHTEGDAMALLFGGSLAKGKTSAPRRLYSVLAGEVLLPAFDIKRSNCTAYLTRIRESGAAYLYGYASAIHILASYLNDAGVSSQLKGVFSTSETLYDHQKELIERVFGCKTYNVYGCAELNSIAFECESHDGYHITDENVIVDVLDSGEPAGPDAMGCLTITTHIPMKRSRQRSPQASYA